MVISNGQGLCPGFLVVIVRCWNQLVDLGHEENGKTLGESPAEVAQAVEVTEFACSLPPRGSLSGSLQQHG